MQEYVTVEGQLTVGKLIELLQQYNSSMMVEVEGCDCVGCAIGVSKERYISKEGNVISSTVLIKRYVG